MSKFKVYKVNVGRYYTGSVLIAAENVEEANKIIDDFIKEDPNNTCDSFG